MEACQVHTDDSFLPFCETFADMKLFSTVHLRLY